MRRALGLLALLSCACGGGLSPTAPDPPTQLPAAALIAVSGQVSMVPEWAGDPTALCGTWAVVWTLREVGGRAAEGVGVDLRWLGSGPWAYQAAHRARMLDGGIPAHGERRVEHSIRTCVLRGQLPLRATITVSAGGQVVAAGEAGD